MPSLRLPVVLVAAALALTGCIRGEEPAPADAEPAATNDTAVDATLPDNRGESSGLKETNKTEEGAGGIEHKHDYWKGQEQVVVFNEPICLSSTPLYPDGEGSQPKSVAYVKLPNTTLVYEGTDRVEVVFGAPRTAFECVSGETDAPNPPAISIQYRSAADAEWRPPMPATPGTPVVIDVAPEMTDMPHSVSSLWVFRVTTDRPAPVIVPMTITAYKGRDVVDWPGHPDFYADNKTSRIVLQKHVTTKMSGIMEGILYDGGGTWVTPEKLISYGTTKLEVIANVTKITSQMGTPATGYFLEVHNATIIGPEITFGERFSDADRSNDLKSYNFSIPVDPAGMDGPYQPQSRWGFRLMATFANVGVPNGPGVGICPGCYPYDIEYDLTVIAIREAGTETMTMDRS